MSRRTHYYATRRWDLGFTTFDEVALACGYIRAFSAAKTIDPSLVTCRACLAVLQGKQRPNRAYREIVDNIQPTVGYYPRAPVK